jgi:hypothetical protein
MSVATSRYSKVDYVNSFNLFLSSDKATIVGNQQSKGDDLQVELEGNQVRAGDGEVIRMSLVNFNMFNNIYDVNENNRRFVLRCGGATDITNTTIKLAMKNINKIRTLGEMLGNALNSTLVDRAIAQGGSSVDNFEVNVNEMPDVDLPADNFNRLIDITLTAKNSGGTAVNHKLTTALFRFTEGFGDAQDLLGGRRLDDETDNDFQGMKVDIEDQTIRIRGFYPAQLKTERNVYIRCNQQQNGLESQVLSNDGGTYPNSVVSSNILGKVRIGGEFIEYEANEHNNYFITLQSKVLNQFRIFLTDSKNRRLGRLTTQLHQETAAGLRNDADTAFEGTDQSTLGNLKFEATLRVDVLKVFNPVLLDAPPPPAPLPARQAQSVLTWQDYGRPKDLTLNTNQF